MSIDDLLSSDELINMAASENRSNMEKIFNLIYGILDLMAIAFIFLPLYGRRSGTYIYSVNLLNFTDTTPVNLTIYWVIFLTIIALGTMGLVMGR